MVVFPLPLGPDRMISGPIIHSTFWMSSRILSSFALISTTCREIWTSPPFFLPSFLQRRHRRVHDFFQQRPFFLGPEVPAARLGGDARQSDDAGHQVRGRGPVELHFFRDAPNLLDIALQRRRV